MRLKNTLILIFAILITLSFVSGEIMLFQPSTSYNFGDSIQISAKVKETSEKSGFLYIYLNCEGQSSNLHIEYLSLSSQEKEIQPSPVPITSSFFKTPGTCKITAQFVDENSETPSFLISNKINVTTSLENMLVSPGESVVLSGTAKKENGKNVEGFIELVSQDLNLNIIRSVENGEFKINFTLPQDSRQGVHLISSRVYEKDKEGNTINEASFNSAVEIKQIPKKIDIALDSTRFSPGSIVKFMPILYDQAGDIIDEDIHVKISNTKEALVYEDIIKSKSENSIVLPFNATPSTNEKTWKIQASSLGLEGQALFAVDELMKASFAIRNSTLIITNIGNVQYRRAIKVQIGTVEEKIEDVKLDVGESREYALKASEGEYDISVTDGIDTITEKTTLAGFPAGTGNVVGIQEYREGALSFLPKYSLAWFFLILVFAMFILLMIGRMDRKKEYSYPVSKNEEPKKVKQSEFISADASNFKKAEYTIVMDGNREEASLIAIKLKNFQSLGKYEIELLDKIENHINDNKGLIYKKDNLIIGIFTPSITKTSKNEATAARVAKEIERHLQDHNKRFRIKIDFGLSVNSGPIAVKKDKDVVKFTSLLNTLNLAKKIADISESEFLLSDSAYKKIVADVKARRVSLEGLNLYKIDSIKGKDEYKQFIDNFMSRQKQENPGF